MRVMIEKDLIISFVYIILVINHKCLFIYSIVFVDSNTKYFFTRVFKCYQINKLNS